MTAFEKGARLLIPAFLVPPRLQKQNTIHLGGARRRALIKGRLSFWGLPQKEPWRQLSKFGVIFADHEIKSLGPKGLWLAKSRAIRVGVLLSVPLPCWASGDGSTLAVGRVFPPPRPRQLGTDYRPSGFG